MKTAIGRETLRITTGLAALIAMALQPGCDGRHFLGTLDGGTGSPGSGGTVGPGTGGAGAATGGSGGAAGNGNTGATGGALFPPRDAGGPSLTDAGPSAPDVGVLGASQSWTGYVENYQFPSGSDLINFTFASDAAGHMVGTIRLGSGTSPPPATDPNVAYPPGVDVNAVLLTGYVEEGFAYSMRDGLLMVSRMRFDINLVELWQGWCALQTPPVGGNGLCIPPWDETFNSPNDCTLHNPSTNQPVPVPCAKAELCSYGVCACSASSCEASPNREVLSFDLSITDARADGSVAGYLGDHNIHVTQDTKGQ